MEGITWLIEHSGKIAQLIGAFTAAIGALAAAIVGLCSMIAKIIPVLSKDHPALPLVKFIGNVALNTAPVKDEDRPSVSKTVPPSSGVGGMALFLILFLLCAPATADITGTQAVNYTWKSKEVIQSTVFTFAETKKVDSFGKWNILTQGWVVDAGPAYDDTHILKSATVLLGKKLGVIGDYFPIDFPFKNKITFKAYFVGVHAEDVFTKPKCQGVSGMGYISAIIKF